MWGLLLGIAVGRKKLTATEVACWFAKWVMANVAVATFAFVVLYLMMAGVDPVAALAQALVGTALIVVAWFEYRRRRDGYDYRTQLAMARERRRVRKAWPKAIGAATNLKRIPKISRLDATPDCTSFQIYVPSHLGVLQKNHDEIRKELGAREMTLLEHRNSGVVRVSLYSKSPLDRVTTVADLPMATREGMVVIGVHHDGSPAMVPWHLSSVVGGSIGSGKSNDVWTELLDLIRQNIPVELYVSDCKGGMEMTILKDQVGKGTDTFKVVQYVTTQAETEVMLKAVHHKNLGRAAWLAKHKMRKNVPTVENPLRVVIIDETLLLPKILKAGVESPLGQIIVSGRATNHKVKMLAQMGQKETLGPIRDVTPIRTAYRTTNDVSTNMFLGDGAAAAGAKCSEIPVSAPGVGYTYNDDTGRIDKFRAPYITDDDIAYIARGELPPGTNTAMYLPPGEQKNYVYWLRSVGGFDEAGEYVPAGNLLYVGLTNNIERRFAQHAETKGWAHLVDWGLARKTYDTYGGRAKAAKAESDAIDKYQPPKNIAGRGKVTRTGRALSLLTRAS